MKKEVSASEVDFYCSTPPKLTLSCILSTKRTEVREMPGMATPPIRLPGVIPFGWEEAPGRPKQKPNQHEPHAGLVASAAADADRRLELMLPPRLSASASMKYDGRRHTAAAAAPPSTILLHEKYFLIKRKRPLLIPSSNIPKKNEMSSDKLSDSSSSSVSVSSRSFKSFSTGSSSTSSYFNGEGESSAGQQEVESKKEVMMVDHEEKGEEREVRILRCKSKRSIFHVTLSHFLTSIIGRLKQAAIVPCSKVDTDDI